MKSAVQLLTCILGLFQPSFCAKLSLSLPRLLPQRDLSTESTFCTTLVLPREENTLYVTSFHPHVSTDVNHITVVGIGYDDNYNFLQSNTIAPKISPCTSLRAEASEEWQTGNGNGKSGRIDTLFITGGGTSAKVLKLPLNVAFRVGGTSPIKRIVLQVHFAPLTNQTDPWNGPRVGVDLEYTTERQPLAAGILSLHAGGVILPQSKTHLEASCQLDHHHFKGLSPFAFLVHTHDLGTSVSGWKVNQDKTQWNLIGKMDPQLDQKFRPTSLSNPVQPGDSLVVRCAMKSNRSYTTVTGASRQEEMCALYLMYWTKYGTTSPYSYCMGGQLEI